MAVLSVICKFSFAVKSRTPPHVSIKTIMFSSKVYTYMRLNQYTLTAVTITLLHVLLDTLLNGVL